MGNVNGVVALSNYRLTSMLQDSKKHGKRTLRLVNIGMIQGRQTGTKMRKVMLANPPKEKPMHLQVL